MLIKTNLSPLACLAPRSVEEAVAQKATNPALLPIAGGTDVMVWMNDGKMPGREYQSLHRLARDWRCVFETPDGGLRIGPLATYSDVRHHPLVSARYPLLVESARVTGALQIQNRGTLVGNVANGSPAADTVPVLMVYGAQLELLSARGIRHVPLAKFYTGYRQNTLLGDELISAVVLPPPVFRRLQHFRKVGTREAQAISKVVFAGAMSEDRSICRLAWGSVGPTTVRATRTEQALASGADLEAAWGILQNEITPIDDIRSTREYRLAVSRRILGEFMGLVSR
jgi:CO/xanthine dehydrogenase FAD-binding subunit